MVRIHRTLAVMAASAVLGGAVAQAVPVVASPPAASTTGAVQMNGTGGQAISPMVPAPSALPPPIELPPTPTPVAYMGFTWNGYSNRDYFDAMVPPSMIPVNDTGDGIVVATELECIAACHARALQVRTRRICGCNALSFYGLLPSDAWPGAKNCFPKHIEACNVPSDLLVAVDGRKLIVKIDPACIPPPGTNVSTVASPQGINITTVAPIAVAPPAPPPPPRRPGISVHVDRDREFQRDTFAADPFADSPVQPPTSAIDSISGRTAAISVAVSALAGVIMMLL